MRPVAVRRRALGVIVMALVVALSACAVTPHEWEQRLRGLRAHYGLSEGPAGTIDASVVIEARTSPAPPYAADVPDAQAISERIISDEIAALFTRRVLQRGSGEQAIVRISDSSRGASNRFSKGRQEFTLQVIDPVTGTVLAERVRQGSSDYGDFDEAYRTRWLEFKRDIVAAFREPAVTARLRKDPPADVTARPVAPAPSTAAPIATTSGSGFLLRQTNLVLTNFHVVRDRKELTIRFPSGEEYPGRVVAQDRSNDLALVEALGLTPSPQGVVVATHTPIKTGEPVHALGYPLGSALSRQPSMVSGTVSSTVGLEDDIARFRMTAPINPGNSGGPIVNARGQVVGIAVAGLIREGVDAVRFGIKASTAALILQQAQVTTAFDVVVTPALAGPRAPDQIFSELAPAVVLIEAR